MADPFLAEIILFGGNFAPRGWALCDGQLLSISQNTALFSILGTTYGGDGRTTFGLPDLRGRVAMHPGSGPGLTTRRLGEKSGVESVILNTTQIPAHNHTATATASGTGTGTSYGTDTQADSGFVGGRTWSHVGPNLFKDATPNVAMKAGNVTLDNLTVTVDNVTVNNTGGSQNHTNIQPYLCVSFIIALQGTFPSRN